MKLVVRGTPLLNGVATMAALLYGSCVPKRSDGLDDCKSCQLSAVPPRLASDVGPPAPPLATLVATGDRTGEGGGPINSDLRTWLMARFKLLAFLEFLMLCGAAGTLLLMGVGAALAAPAADDGEHAGLRAGREYDDA